MNKTFRYQHIYSSVDGKSPSADTIYTAEIAINGYPTNEHLYIKNSNNEVVSFDTAEEIDAKLALKLDASAYTPIEVSSALTSGDTNPVQGGAIYDVIAENELVISNALNALNDGKQNVLTAGSGISISGDVISVTGGSGGGVTSGEVQTMIDQSISGKVNTSDFDVYSAATENVINDKLDISDFNTYSGAVDTKFGDYYTTAQTSAATEIATALNGKVNTSNVTSAVTNGSTDVLTSGGAYAQFGGLKLVKLTQAEYDALSPNYDANTIYYIVN